MIIARNSYLEQLKERMGNGLIKIVTGIRRCGKSFLLFRLFTDYLKNSGVSPEHIITVDLEDEENEKYCDVSNLSDFLKQHIADDGQMHYLLLDEIQYAISKKELKSKDNPPRLYRLLNGLMKRPNVDIYVTGSNSKMLSNDISTEFRGRGDKIRLHPLSFYEYFSAVDTDRVTAFDNYMLYGGMPQMLTRQSQRAKLEYASDLFSEVYRKDIMERYEIEFPDVLDKLTDTLCSSIGSLTNVTKLTATIRSSGENKCHRDTVARYLEYLQEAMLFTPAKRYDVKGRKYFDYPMKFYCEDIGLRNMRLNLRQQEETHIMENIIFNELVRRGYAVDVGVIQLSEKTEDGKTTRKNCEIDFVANLGSRRYYIQSAWRLDGEGKAQQEIRPLLNTADSFIKIIITRTTQPPWLDDKGILHLGIYDFLLNQELPFV